MIPIIDTGHGYTTKGKESKFHSILHNNRRVPLLKENSVNEAVGNKLSYLYWQDKVEAHFISNEWYDISLQQRCNRENELYVKDETMFISIHADAFHVKDAVTGGRFFYYGEEGRKIALHMTSYLQDNSYPLRLRQPMKANFKVLRSTKSPAVLFEMGFMTTKSDLNFLLNDEFRNKTAKLLFEAINSL